MKRRNEHRLIVRVAKGNETTSSFRTAARLAIFDVRQQRTGKRYFVLVQSSRPNIAVDCAGCKKHLKDQYGKKFKKFLSRGKRRGFSKIVF